MMKIICLACQQLKKRCSVCDEVVLDNKHSLINGKPICQSCFKGSYYEII
ncbi:hypothetical protein [Methanobrevibacter arboriphilus]|nr:hypothetical protein [Methanobrevibacter arboriphilus]